jgi:hypothetical protein
MNIRNWFVDKDNNDRTWYKIVNLLSTVIALWLGYVAYNLGKYDNKSQNFHYAKIDFFKWWIRWTRLYLQL